MNPQEKSDIENLHISFHFYLLTQCLGFGKCLNDMWPFVYNQLIMVDAQNHTKNSGLTILP